MTASRRQVPHIPDEVWRQNIIDSMKGEPLGPIEKRKIADEMLALAKQAGIDIRRARLWRRIDKLRQRTKALGQTGRYPKRLWHTLRELEAEYAADLSGG